MNTLAMASALSDEFDILCIAGKPLAHEHTAEHLLKIYTGFRLELIDEFKREVFLVQDYVAYKKIKSVIRNFKPDIVHTHGSKPGILGRWAARRLKVPLIMHTFHGHVFHGYFSDFVSGLIVRLERFMAKFTHVIIAINKQMEHDLIHQYAIAPAQKVAWMPLGLDVGYYQQEESLVNRSAMRRRLGLNDQDMVVAAIGRLVPVKQHSLFIHLAIQLLRDHHHIPFRFLIVGDGSERENLLNMIQSAGFTYHIGERNETKAPFHFLLWRTDIPEILSAIDILLHTSFNEGTPVSILEAMAMGKPVVATPVGGIPELFEAAGAGFTSSNQNELIHSVLELAQDEKKRNDWGDKARKMVTENMTIREQVGQFRTLVRAKMSV
jgi:glycosyltransferase involved in cell wall biosynthesis